MLESLEVGYAGRAERDQFAVEREPAPPEKSSLVKLCSGIR
jgi:hypothetical protein